MRFFSFRNLIKVLLILVIILLSLTAIALYLGISSDIYADLPTENQLKDIRNNTASEVYTADSVLIGRYFIQDRTNIPYKDISPHVIHALIATEDARFYHHKGVDFKSLLRVLFKTIIFDDESAGGGSTISQQLAKNLYPRQRYRHFSMAINKIREMIIANRLESVYSKEDILELYLNTVPMGGNIYGIERAAKLFFSKSAADLRPHEAAVLIGMLKANTSYNPLKYPQNSTYRRNVVLDQMVRYHFLTPEAADSLKKLPLSLHYRPEATEVSIAPYFREQLRLELVKWCQSQTKANGEPYNLYTDGLRIYTTIDSRMQRIAERAVRNQMAKIQQRFDRQWRGRTPWGRNTSFLQTAIRQSDRYQQLKSEGKSESEIREIFRKPVKMSLFAWGGKRNVFISPLDSIRYYQRLLNTGLLSVEPSTGFIKAWVGGINHYIFKYDHVLSKRQAGSTFKPIVYTAALQRGIAPCRYFENQRKVYPEFENWSPQNADNVYGGKYTMKGALAHSVNTISAQIIMKTGIKPTISLARKMGIESDIPEVPSIALGTAGLSLYEMVAAYMVFANRGKAVHPVYLTSIIDSKNHTLLQYHPSSNPQVISSDNAAIMLEMLKDVVDEGSASDLRKEYQLRMEIAGKTGTTQNQADGWFIGMTPRLITGIWVGAENPAVHFIDLKEGSGAKTALPVWANYMVMLTRQPSFSSYQYSRFPALPSTLKDRLDCPSFIPDPVVQEQPPAKKESFFKRLLKKGLGLFKKKKKDQDKNQQEQSKPTTKEKK